MRPPFPCPVSTWHNDTYDTISPTREELRCHGKTVIITGAGSGVGREAAITFATAGAKCVVLVGRTAKNLHETKAAVAGANASTICSVYPADVSDEKAMGTIASEVGTWDIFIQNAGYVPAPAPLASADIDDSWRAYETNVKAVLITAKVFLPTSNKTRAVLLGTISGPMMFPAAQAVGFCAYQTSKLALARTFEFLSAENPHLFTASLHPGMVDTAMFKKSGASTDQVPMDSVKLPAHFMLWLSSPEASDLDGRTVWSNWDVDELKTTAKKIREQDLMTVSVRGWPYSML